jgi:O-antigen/teichoic acid export membrane protein
MILYVFINIIVYSFGEYLVKRNTKRLSLKNVSASFETVKWRSSAIPLFFLGGIQTFGAQSDVFLLGLLSESEEVGVFKSMYQVSLLVIFSLSAVNAISSPLIVKDFETNNFSGLKKLLINFCSINFFIALSIAIPLLFFGEHIIEFLYGPEYLSGILCLQILVIGRIINTTFGSANQFLKMMGEEKKAFYGILIGVLTSILLNIILIPIYGIVGSAIASSIGLVMWNIILFFRLVNKIWVRR